MSLPKSVAGRLRRVAAFTLVELLVVIGIIALLISILLPSLAKARDAAVTVQCMSQMRQIGQFIMMYAADNKGVFPMEVRIWMDHEDTWQDHLIPYDGRKLTDAQMANWVIDPATGQNAKWLYCCPTQLGLNEAQGFGGPGSFYWTSYIANLVTYWQNWDWQSGVFMPQINVTVPGTGTIIPGKNLGSIRDAANVIMVFETTYAATLGTSSSPNIMQGFVEFQREGLRAQVNGFTPLDTEPERPHNGVGAGLKATAVSTCYWNGKNIYNFRARGKYNYLMADGHVANMDPMETLAQRLVPPQISANGMWVDGKNTAWHW